MEANPTVFYAITDWLSIGGCVLFIYGKGEVENGIGPLLSPIAISRSSDETEAQLGYNLAVSIRPNERWTLAATYRSKVTLDLDGHADHAGGAFWGLFQGWRRVHYPASGAQPGHGFFI